MDNYALANVFTPQIGSQKNRKVQTKGQIEFAERLKGFIAIYECRRACECIRYEGR